MVEDGGSYNSEIAHLITLYINRKVKKNEEVGINDFILWFKNNLREFGLKSSENYDVIENIFLKAGDEEKENGRQRGYTLVGIISVLTGIIVIGIIIIGMVLTR